MHAYGVWHLVTSTAADAFQVAVNVPVALVRKAVDASVTEAYRLLDLGWRIGQTRPTAEPSMETVELSVLILQEGKTFVAQCLNYDIAAHGSSIEAAEKALREVFIDRIALDKHVGQPLLKAIEQAPQFYWKRFNARKARKLDAFDLDIPSAFAIAARASDVRLFTDSHV